MTLEQLKEKYLEHKKIKDEANVKDRAKRDIEEKAETAEIVNCFSRAGIILKYNNGYVFEGWYKGFTITVCNQTDRMVGSYYRLPEDTDLAREVFGELQHSEHCLPELYADFVEIYKYRNLCIDGSCEHALRLIMEMIEQESINA